MQRKQILIAGGGIGGLAAALGCALGGCDVRLYERAQSFSEVGAGVQLGPNVVRCLDAWGLNDALQSVAAFPDCLRVRSAHDGRELARLPLGATTVARYGAAYATIHRADLHALLLQAVQAVQNSTDGQAQVHLKLNHTVQHHIEDSSANGTAVVAHLLRGDGTKVEVEGDALVGADGLRSGTRARLLGQQVLASLGHLAWRAVLRQSALPTAMRTTCVTAWLGRDLHVVQYPLRRGELMNVVAIHRTPLATNALARERGRAEELEALFLLAGTCASLQNLICAVPHASINHPGGWHLWPLLDRRPVSGPHEMVRGVVALLGDAAHPMHPYLAQGAGMALEDAASLQNALALHDCDLGLRLRRYALNRWQRNARVQARARRNGTIFHASGPLRWARDLTLRMLGERVLDMPWLYRGA